MRADLFERVLRDSLSGHNFVMHRDGYYFSAELADLEVWSDMAKVDPLRAATSRIDGPLMSNVLPPLLALEVAGLRSPSVVVDFGCGYGRLIPAVLGQSKHTIIGIDGSRGMLESGLKVFEEHYRELKNFVNFVHCSLTETPLPSDSADLIYTSAVLLHNTPDAVPLIINEARRILRTGGKFVLVDTFPYRKSIAGLINLLYSGLPGNSHRNGPVRSFTKNTLDRYFRDFSQVRIHAKGKRTVLPKTGIGKRAISAIDSLAERLISAESLFITTHLDLVATK